MGKERVGMGGDLAFVVLIRFSVVVFLFGTHCDVSRVHAVSSLCLLHLGKCEKRERTRERGRVEKRHITCSTIKIII